MGKTVVVINRHVIARNRREQRDDPPIRVTNGKYGKPKYHKEFNVVNGTVKYSPEAPLPCGATVWIECD